MLIGPILRLGLGFLDWLILLPQFKGLGELVISYLGYTVRQTDGHVYLAVTDIVKAETVGYELVG